MMVVLMLIAAIVGDAVNYTIGRLFGEKLFSNPNSKIFRRSYLDKTHQFYEKHGGKTIILARFVPIVRNVRPVCCGNGPHVVRHFAAYNVIGALLWVLLFTYAGYFFGTLPFIQSNLKLMIVGIIFVSILPCFRIYSPQTRSGTRKIKSNSAVRPLFYPKFRAVMF